MVCLLFPGSVTNPDPAGVGKADTRQDRIAMLYRLIENVMSRYIVNIGKELCFVLKNACSSQPEQFAGYCANLDFWMCEFRHLKEISDSYETRLIRMTEARNGYLEAGNTRPQNLDDCSEPYQRPRRTTQDGERHRVVEEAMNHLLRFCERGLDLGTIHIEDYDNAVRELEQGRETYKSL